MKTRWLAALAAIALWCIPAKGQGQSYTAGPFFQSGNLYVCPVPSGGTPCPTPSSIFTNVGLTTPAPNPIPMNAGSTVTFFAAGGQYTIQYPASGYSTVISLGSSSGSSGQVGEQPPIIVQNGLQAEYLALSTDTVASLKDYSGNNNNATGTVGTAPTLGAAPQGGLVCPGNGGVSLPAGLNPGANAFTVQLFVNYQGANDTNINGSTQGFSFPIMGNTTSHAFGFGFFSGSDLQLTSPFTNGGHFLTTFPVGYQVASVMNGVALLSYTVPSSAADSMYINTTGPLGTIGGGAGNSANRQNSGNWQLCGTAINQGITGLTTWFTGTIYAALIYNRALTAGEVTANYYALTSMLQNRGVISNVATTATADEILGLGDSIFADANSSSDPFSQHLLTLNGSWNVSNLGIGTSQLQAFQAAAAAGFNFASMLPTNAGRNAVIIQAGSNDVVNSIPTATIVDNLASVCNLARGNRPIAKCFVVTVLDRTGISAAVETLDTAIRLNWRSFADDLIDPAGDPNLGGSGANASATFFSDSVHPTVQAGKNIETHIYSRELAAEFGGAQDFNSATTYTSGVAAATAITALAEATNTVTVTTTLNPPVGSCIPLSGNTPAGYNSPSGECWYVLTTSASSWTYYNGTTGLGAGSVFGTNVAPLEKDNDTRYVILGGSSAAQNYTLQTCQGRGKNANIMITNTNAWTITPFGSETINGAASLTSPVATASNHPVVSLKPVIVSPSAQGCVWQASIQ